VKIACSKNKKSVAAKGEFQMHTDKVTAKLNSAQQKQIARRCRTLEPIWCTACAKLVKMVTIEGATAVVKEVPQTVCQRVGNQTLHCIKTQTGSLFVCFNSLV
jgi:hypothetical protein